MRQSLSLDLDLDVLVDHRVDPDAGEAGVPPRVAVVRRDAHQPVHARFALEPAVGVLALDLQRGRLEPRLLARARLHQRDLVAALLAPADIHAREHLGPVLALGAAGAGVHLQVGVVAVGLAGEQRLHLLAARVGRKLAQGGLALLDGGVVVLGLAQLDQGDGVVEVALELDVGVDRALQRLALAHDLLGGLRAAPQPGVLGALVQLGQALLGGIPVKDASATASGTGARHRRASRLRHAWAASSMCKVWLAGGYRRAGRRCKRRPASQRCVFTLRARLTTAPCRS